MNQLYKKGVCTRGFHIGFRGVKIRIECVRLGVPSAVVTIFSRQYLVAIAY